MEADPGTFDAGRLREYMALGVTRFSVGVQAFQEASAHPLKFKHARRLSLVAQHVARAAPADSHFDTSYCQDQRGVRSG